MKTTNKITLEDTFEDIHSLSSSIILVKTDYYTISYNSDKNRLYFSVYGRWKSESLVPNFLTDWQEVVEKLKPNFTIISDARQMKPQSIKIEKLHQQAQKYLIENGLLHVAEIVSTNDIANFQACRIVEKTQMPNHKFTTLEKAEEYLDNLIKK